LHLRLRPWRALQRRVPSVALAFSRKTTPPLHPHRLHLHLHPNVLRMHHSRLLSCWFWVDIISCFPYEVLANDDEGRLPKLLRVLKLSKLFRLLRLVRIVRILRVLQRLEYSLHMQEGKAQICTSPTCHPANQPLGRPATIAERTLIATRCLPHLAAPVSSKPRTPLTTHTSAACCRSAAAGKFHRYPRHHHALVFLPLLLAWRLPSNGGEQAGGVVPRLRVSTVCERV
jgi:hypothetical protein